MRIIFPIIFIIALIIPQFSLSQSKLDYGNEINHIKVCNYVQANSFSSDKEAETVLDLILSTVGAEKRFVLKPCSNISNAVAVQMSGIRYIFYDPVFINNISKGEFWIKFFVLAHEVGHHINGHVVDINSFGTKKISLYERRLQELESDRFAGFILSKLGASLNETIAAVSQGSNSDDTYSTHPNRDKRVLAAKQGFNKAKSNESIYTKSNVDKAEELFYKAKDYNSSGRFQDAINIYNYLISNNSTLPYIYYNRGEAYFSLRQYNSALYDFKYQIRLTPNLSRAYYTMGNTYHKLRYYKEQAITSYLKSIKLMESESDYKHIGNYYIPNSEIIISAYAMAALNMEGSRQYLRYSCGYAKKAYQFNKYQNVLIPQVNRTLIDIINRRCR
jgi:tetratricopeptide (TPR) repeat protein